MINKSQQTVVVGMSGGVDSSVTAALLKQQGYFVIGVYMKNWSEDFGDYGCTWAQDAEDARKVAQVLGIPFYVWNFEKEYYSKVVEYFLREYEAGRTPNPDVLCNSEIKFKVFLDKAMALGADFVATGHYARVRKTNDEYELLKGVDPAKDQSYFLYRLNQAQLSKVLFPIGEYQKNAVRELARNFKLPTHAKKDSQGICFIGQIDVMEFLREHIKAMAGQIVTSNGQVVGSHTGLPYYTIGQREGIGIGGSGPYYVVGKDFQANRLMVTNDKNDTQLWRRKFQVTDLTWAGKSFDLPLECGVSIRYHHPEYDAVLTEISNGIEVNFLKPQRAITPGQAAVFYMGEKIIGGGIIGQVF
jgi:tRNA-uridine 2-sulfurtransferase